MKCVPHSLVDEITECRVTAYKGFIQTSLISPQFVVTLLLEMNVGHFSVCAWNKTSEHGAETRIITVIQKLPLAKVKDKNEVDIFFWKSVWSTRNTCQKEKQETEFYIQVLEILLQQIPRMRLKFWENGTWFFCVTWPCLFCHDSEVLPGITMWCSAADLKSLDAVPSSKEEAFMTSQKSRITYC
jgi:hypothetical protein